MKQGRFVTFEGLDGAGKTTQLRLASAYLKRRGIPHIVTREPGGTELGAAIRKVLLDPASKLDAGQELLLYLADRALHVSQVIVPALAEGLWVLCDRYVDSTVAYQGFGRDRPIWTIVEMCHQATAGLTPDLTVLLDLDPDQCAHRLLCKSKDRIEQAGNDFFHRARHGFRELARSDPHRFLVLDATKPIDELAALVAARLVPPNFPWAA